MTSTFYSMVIVCTSPSFLLPSLYITAILLLLQQNISALLMFAQVDQKLVMIENVSL